MKKILLSLISLTCLCYGASNHAQVANLSSENANAICNQWDGFYFGGNIGAAWSTTKWSYLNVNPYDATDPDQPILATSNRFYTSRLLGGAQVGFNYQICQFILGPELGYFWGNFAKSKPNVVQIFAPFEEDVKSTYKRIYTATGRFGTTVNPNWLLYGKGGYAGTMMYTKGSVTQNFAGGLFDWDSAKHHNGWVVGAGSEHRVMEHLCIGVEYNYVQFSTIKQVGGIAVVNSNNQVEHNVKANIQNVLFRINILV